MNRVYFLVAILVSGLFACNNPKDNSSGKRANEPHEEAAQFLSEAVSGGLMEVELGKLAQQKAVEARVKTFGGMMIRDHTDAGEELKSLAASKNIVVPETLVAKHQKQIDDLTKKNGVGFDKAYIKMMLKDHKDDIKKFEAAAKNSEDADLKALAAKILPVLRMHLDSAKAINRKVRASLDAGDITDGMETFPQR